ncbi:hypothetical protein FQN50_001111 [Emmonsiellopsis sp. PD_5]|nr:hypothetical protein FQN50_001111 [Emmonsiellopsis sp. PD_5]
MPRRSCEHREIEPMLCPLASSVVPCNIVSEHKLKCGHIIPTICGENTSGFCRECTTGIKETSPTMNLSCGHVVYVEELDRHVGLPEIIQLHPDGSLDRVDAGSLNSANLFCPVCLAKFDNIPRYSILTGLQRLPENIDSLLLNVGQKYQMLGKRLLYHEKALRDTFKSFREEIRPTPLSAAQNRLLVQERASGLAEVRTHILETKEQLVMPLERNLIFLHKQLHNGNLLSKTNFHFGIRFVLLFYRCRYAFLRDQIKISSFLLALDDPSYQTRILAESLRRTAIMHGKDTIGKLGSITVECESKLLKTLEVETRLLQLGFYCLVKRGQRLNCFQGKDLTDDANITSDEPDDDIIADLGGKGPEKFDINSSIRKMALLCRQYPKSAGLYVEQIESIRHEVHSGFKPVYLFPAETRVVERAWGMASRQGLSKCENFHFYPAADFDECPECGKEEVEADKPNYETFLAEEKFLCWMRSGSQD